MYLLDSNIFIQAKNLHYGFDICPAFWDWLEKEHQNEQRVASVEKVLEELRDRTDELTTWAEQQNGFFLPPDGDVLASLREVGDWANDAGYDQAAVNEFLEDADYYLIAHARATGLTVVTHEKVENSKKRIKIPNACTEVSVDCINAYEMLRREGAKFVLGSQP
jgi:hypothetical protein